MTSSSPLVAAPEVVALSTRLDARLRRDVAWVAVVSGAAAALSTGDFAGGGVQIAAALALLLAGSRAEVRPLSGPLRAVMLVFCVAFAFGTSSDPRVMLARFLAAVCAATLVQPKRPREHGLVLAIGLLEVALAALLTTGPLALVGGALFAVTVHQALGTFHRAKAAKRLLARGGVAAAPLSDRRAATSSLLASVSALALTAPFFLVLPRLDRPLLSIGPPGDLVVEAMSESMRLSGSPSVADGHEVLGQAAPKNDAARSREPYFRVAAYEAFDGVEWTTARPERGGREFAGVTIDPASLRADVLDGRSSPPARLAEFDLAFAAAAAPRLPVPEGVVALTFRPPAPARLDRDLSGGLRPWMGGSTPRFSYLASAGPLSAHAGFPRADDPAARGLLSLPPSLRAGLRPLLSGVVPAGATTREKARAIEAFVRGTCSYSLTVAPPRDSKQPVLDFLTRTRSGHCEYFAAALAACLRAEGVPARVVAGFHAGLWNDLAGGFWVVRRKDAHAWVEAWVGDGEGGSSWARFDATPPGILEPDPYAGFTGFLARLLDLAHFEWNRLVIGFDRDAQRRTIAGSARALAALAEALTSFGCLLAGSATAAGGLLWWASRRRARRAARARSRVAFYEALLVALDRRRLARRPEETAGQYAVRMSGALEPSASAALSEATRAFEEVRYGGRPTPDSGAPARWLSAVSRRRGG